MIGSDLIQASILMVAFSLLAMATGALATRRRSHFHVTVVHLVSVTSLSLYMLLIWDRPVLSEFLPASSLIILGNWLPLWACFFVGSYLATSSRIRVRQCVLSTLAFAFSVVSVVAPMLGESPDCQPDGGAPLFQYQTSPYTCSAASATTLLRLHGLAADEQEMAELALTRQGTHWMGVYRALKLKTRNSGWDVVVEPIDLDHMPALPDTPALLALNFDPSCFAQDIDHGFNGMTGHSVVSLGTSGKDFTDVFDPSPDYGFEKWGAPIWKSATFGVALRLMPRGNTVVSVDEVKRRVAASRRQGVVVAR